MQRTCATQGARLTRRLVHVDALLVLQGPSTQHSQQNATSTMIEHASRQRAQQLFTWSAMNLRLDATRQLLMLTVRKCCMGSLILITGTLSSADCHHWTQIHHLSRLQCSPSHSHLHWRSANYGKTWCQIHFLDGLEPRLISLYLKYGLDQELSRLMEQSCGHWLLFHSV